MKKNPYYYIGANPTVDLILINHLNEVLVIQRSENSPACPLMWAFPGGFVDTLAKRNETWLAGFENSQKAAKRELKEEANIDLGEAEILFVGEYEGHQRDPRDNEVSWSKSTAYYYQMDEQTFNQVKHIIEAKDDAKDYKWLKISEALQTQLAFDHNHILVDCLKKYRPDLLQITEENLRTTKVKI